MKKMAGKGHPKGMMMDKETDMKRGAHMMPEHHEAQHGNGGSKRAAAPKKKRG